jgi:hypothetical protein
MKRTLATGIVLSALSIAATLVPADAAPTLHARPSAKAGSFTVTAGVNKTEPLVGSKVKIRGSVKPAAPGSRVTLQVRYQDQKAWKSIDSATLSGASRYKFKDKVNSVRERKYRVLKPAGPNRNAGRSPSVKVTVFGWRDLTSLSPVTALYFVESGTTLINGNSYLSSITGAGTGNGSIAYNLNRDCTRLDAVYGLGDSSPSGGSTTITLTANGVQKHTGAYALAQAQRVVTDVTGIFRIEFTSAPQNGGVPAIGTPKVLCSI